MYFSEISATDTDQKDERAAVYTTDNFAYIKCAEIGDEKVRGDFENWIIGKTIPLLDGEKNLAYAHDWARFWRWYRRRQL